MEVRANSLFRPRICAVIYERVLARFYDAHLTALEMRCFYILFYVSLSFSHESWEFTAKIQKEMWADVGVGVWRPAPRNPQVVEPS